MSTPVQGPWAKYGQDQSQASGPWEKYAAPSAPAPTSGAIGASWVPSDAVPSGLQGPATPAENNKVALSKGLPGLGKSLVDTARGIQSSNYSLAPKNSPFRQSQPFSGVDAEAKNPDEMAGKVFGNIAQMAVPMDAAAGVLPSAERAGAKLSELSGKLSAAPVNLSKTAPALERASEVSARGGGSMGAAGKLLQRTEPKLPAGVSQMSRDDAMAARMAANATGQHAGNMSGVRTLTDQMPQGKYLKADIPLSKLDYQASNPSLVQQYAAKPGAFPASYGTLQKAKILLEDGNHRAAAALLRGDKNLSTIVPKQDYMKFAGIPDKPPLNFPEARDFYSNISKQSAMDRMSQSPTLKRSLGNVRGAFHEDLATTAGKGLPATEIGYRGQPMNGGRADYENAMDEYRHAKQMQGAGKFLVKKAAPAVLGAGLAAEGVRKLVGK